MLPLRFLPPVATTAPPPLRRAWWREHELCAPKTPPSESPILTRRSTLPHHRSRTSLLKGSRGERGWHGCDCRCCADGRSHRAIENPIERHLLRSAHRCARKATAVHRAPAQRGGSCVFEPFLQCPLSRPCLAHVPPALLPVRSGLSSPGVPPRVPGAHRRCARSPGRAFRLGLSSGAFGRAGHQKQACAWGYRKAKKAAPREWNADTRNLGLAQAEREFPALRVFWASYQHNTATFSGGKLVFRDTPGRAALEAVGVVHGNTFGN